MECLINFPEAKVTFNCHSHGGKFRGHALIEWPKVGLHKQHIHALPRHNVHELLDQLDILIPRFIRQYLTDHFGRFHYSAIDQTLLVFEAGTTPFSQPPIGYIYGSFLECFDKFMVLYQ